MKKILLNNLKSRYLVMPYPHYPFDGNILLVDEHGELFHETEKYCDTTYKIMESDIQNCINFRKLKWYEMREESEMPKYLKWNSGVYKIASLYEGVNTGW